jgi:hypothetical protein
MSRSVNLTGKVFGKLTVIKKDNIRKNGKTAYLCQCNCISKTQIIIVGTSLTRKKQPTKSCGCLIDVS